MNAYWIIERKSKSGTVWHFESCHPFEDEAQVELKRLRNKGLDGVEFRVREFVPAEA